MTHSTSLLKRLAILAAVSFTLPLTFHSALEASNDKPVVEFEWTSTGVPENIGTYDLQIDINPASSTELTLQYTVWKSKWTDDDDFRLPLPTGMITVPAMATTAKITVTIIDDAEYEPLQAVRLTLTDTEDYDLGPAPFHTVHITDDEVELVEQIGNFIRQEDNLLNSGSARETLWKRVLLTLGAPDKVDLRLANETTITHSEATTMGAAETSSLWSRALNKLGDLVGTE